MWRRGPDGEIVRSDPSPPASEPETGSPSALPNDSRRRQRASLGLALRLGLRDSYDHLGGVLLVSVAWAAGTALAALGGQSLGGVLSSGLPGQLPTLLRLATALVALVLVGGPLSAGVFRWARNAAARESPEVFDLGWGFSRALLRSLALAAAQTSFSVVLAANCAFYLSRHHPVFTVLGAIFGYLLLLWIPACHYGWPLLAEQEIGVRQVLKKSCLLVLDNLGFSLGLGLLMLVLSLVLWATMVGGVLLWAGLLALCFTQATRELLRKYGVLGPDPSLDPIMDEVQD